MNHKALTANQRSIISKIKEGGVLIPFKSGSHLSYVMKYRGKREAVMAHAVESLVDRGLLCTEKGDDLKLFTK